MNFFPFSGEFRRVNIGMHWLLSLLSLCARSHLLFGKHECEPSRGGVSVTVTCMVINKQIPAPISEGSPYIPVITYTIDWPMVMIMPNTKSGKGTAYKVGRCLVLERWLLNPCCARQWGEQKQRTWMGAARTGPRGTQVTRSRCAVAQMPSDGALALPFHLLLNSLSVLGWRRRGEPRQIWFLGKATREQKLLTTM